MPWLGTCSVVAGSVVAGMVFLTFISLALDCAFPSEVGGAVVFVLGMGCIVSSTFDGS